jgi:hypothetical protein
MPRALNIISHWHHSVENLSTSAQEFYASLEIALMAKDVVGLSAERLEWNEGGILTAKRLYLRVSYKRFVFDISAFPFGKDFMFSWWLGKKTPNLAALGCGIVAGVPLLLASCLIMAGIVKGIFLFVIVLAAAGYGFGSGLFEVADDIHEAIAEMPVFGPVYKRLFNPATYYSEDTRQIFEETVHRAMIDVVGGVLSINQMTPLTDADKAVESKRGR